jgi:hypothetical protein
LTMMSTCFDEWKVIINKAATISAQGFGLLTPVAM